MLDGVCKESLRKVVGNLSDEVSTGSGPGFPREQPAWGDATWLLTEARPFRLPP